MKKWTTSFHALDAKTGKLKQYYGELVEANTLEEAQEWCYNNRGHLVVVGEFIEEIPFSKSSKRDWSELTNML